MDPRHVRVVQIAAPTTDELRLARFWSFLAGAASPSSIDPGTDAVEEELATTEQWRRAYTEILDFERTLAAEGMVFAKFWMHISQEEQLERFESRQDSPLKQWKLTDEDWRNRKRRAEYEVAVEEMLAKTSWAEGPWHVVPAEQKRYARVTVLETAAESIEAGMRRHGMEPVPPLDAEDDD